MISARRESDAERRRRVHQEESAPLGLEVYESFATDWLGQIPNFFPGDPLDLPANDSMGAGRRSTRFDALGAVRSSQRSAGGRSR